MIGIPTPMPTPAPIATTLSLVADDGCSVEGIAPAVEVKEVVRLIEVDEADELLVVDVGLSKVVTTVPAANVNNKLELLQSQPATP